MSAQRCKSRDDWWELYQGKFIQKDERCQLDLWHPGPHRWKRHNWPNSEPYVQERMLP